jgi:DNA (cytosine-5)-methyltransferase 1
VGVAEWLGRRLAGPGRYDESEATRLTPGEPWPTAAWGADGERWRSSVSMWPERRRYRHLRQVLDLDHPSPLTRRAAAGFLERTHRAKLRFDEEFLLDVKRHVEAAKR